MIDILARISEYRIKRNWTEYQLAEESGLTQSTISTWYRKDMLPSLSSLEKICNAFGITMSQFFATDVNIVSLTDIQQDLLSEISYLSKEQQVTLLEFLKTL
ncbi:MAG: helix-turn-helix transcriptional regulator [Clostridiales bacterium]|nr:helix-turn-helix transcriptional regulator [Clostridiales bacterium]